MLATLRETGGVYLFPADIGAEMIARGLATAA